MQCSNRQEMPKGGEEDMSSDLSFFWNKLTSTLLGILGLLRSEGSLYHVTSPGIWGLHMCDTSPQNWEESGDGVSVCRLLQASLYTLLCDRGALARCGLDERRIYVLQSGAGQQRRHQSRSWE